MSADVLEIVEIIGPSQQGYQKPYKCRAEDGHLYFVKGRQTNRASLWHEWICAHLARAFGLGVPPCALVNVSEEILQEAPPTWRDLGAGIAFGSQNHPSAAWLEQGMFDRVPTEIQRDVLVFDWWVRNTDRQTYNANLLWDTASQELVVIDHNLAFDPTFSAGSFMQHHVFAHQWPYITADLACCAEYGERLSHAKQTSLEAACDNVPPEWEWENPECDVPARLDLASLRALLSRCETAELWRTV